MPFAAFVQAKNIILMTKVVDRGAAFETANVRLQNEIKVNASERRKKEVRLHPAHDK